MNLVETCTQSSDVSWPGAFMVVGIGFAVALIAWVLTKI